MGASESSAEELLAALLTPWAPGGIAVIAVAGSRAEEIIESCFRRAPADGALAYGHWIAEAGVVDEVLVRRVRPRSGEPAAPGFEIHGHGGIGAARAILASLEEQGARLVPVEELPRPADEDALITAARHALDRTVSERAARLLLDQLDGALSRELIRLERGLRAGQDLDRAAGELERLAEVARLGIALCQPTGIALLGRPNVGKSSLLNRLVGRERALVSDRPGTTRDPVRAELLIEGVPFRVVDTAGIRGAVDALEAKGIDASWRESERSSLWVLIFDRSEPPRPEDLLLEERARARRCVRVLNKSDLRPSGEWGAVPGIATSCQTGEGLESLRSAIVDSLELPVSGRGAAVPFTVVQQDAIARAARRARTAPERAAQRLEALRRGLGSRDGSV